jgi:putative ABC transport system ATP-binding protein
MPDSLSEVRTDSPPAAIEARGLGKRVAQASGELVILEDIDLCIRSGESVAIQGASGSGKSTLLALLAGLDHVTSGKVWLCGQDLAALDEDARARLRARKVGFVFQSFQLLPHLDALENVRLPLDLAGELTPRMARERAAALLARVGLADRLHHLPSVLSGGEQQRVALARAFASAPQVLLADEPTGSLDAATGERVSELLFAMNRDQGSTLVLVTHDPVLAARCSRRIVLRAGRCQDAA